MYPSGKSPHALDIISLRAGGGSAPSSGTDRSPRVTWRWTTICLLGSHDRLLRRGHRPNLLRLSNHNTAFSRIPKYLVSVLQWAFSTLRPVWKSWFKGMYTSPPAPSTLLILRESSDAQPEHAASRQFFSLRARNSLPEDSPLHSPTS